MSLTTSPLNSAKLAWVVHGPRSVPALSAVAAEKSTAVTAAEFTAEDAWVGSGRESELSALAPNIASILINRDWWRFISSPPWQSAFTGHSPPSAIQFARGGNQTPTP